MANMPILYKSPDFVEFLKNLNKGFPLAAARIHRVANKSVQPLIISSSYSHAIKSRGSRGPICQYDNLRMC